MSKARRLLEAEKPAFDATINGFHFIAYDDSDNIIDEKVISLVGVDNMSEAINDFIEAINFMKKYKDKVIWLSEPVI